MNAQFGFKLNSTRFSAEVLLAFVYCSCHDGCSAAFVLFLIMYKKYISIVALCHTQHCHIHFLIRVGHLMLYGLLPFCIVIPLANALVMSCLRFRNALLDVDLTVNCFRN